MDAFSFLVTLEAEGDGEGVTIGSGSTSSSGSGCSNASDFDEEGTGLVAEPEVFGCSVKGKLGGGGVKAWACWSATISGFSRGFRVDVPFRTSHIEHLKASALFLNVHTLQSQVASSRSRSAAAGTLLLEVRFRLESNESFKMSKYKCEVRLILKFLPFWGFFTVHFRNMSVFTRTY